MGGAPAFVWPGGGITVLVDVMAMPDNAFGYVPTPAIVGPIEFTMPLPVYQDLGGHMAQVRPLSSLTGESRVRFTAHKPEHPWPAAPVRRQP